jgi:hypothetical protein
VRHMYPGRCRNTGGSRITRNPIWPVAIVVLVALGSLGVLGAPSAASFSRAPTTNLTPAAGTPPSIFFFSASPSVISEGSSVSFSVGASGPGALTYSYLGLPAGCPSTNTSFFSCTPTAPGLFNVTVIVIDTTTPQPAASWTILLVNEVATGTFFELNQTTANWTTPASQDCSSINSPPFYQNFCYPEAQQPTLLPLANGTLGLAYQRETSVSSNACASLNTTVARVVFQTSTNNGSTFGALTDLGNDTCTYLNAIEPSFAVGGGAIYGAFIEENSSLLPWNYVSRGQDALGFVTSTNNGTSFSTAVTLDASGNLARPVVAAFGSTVYVAYEDIANSSTPIAGGVLPISIKLLVSVNGGVSWSGPATLPGFNASAGYTALSPAIAVNATGAVSVAYATDRSCLSMGALGCAIFGDNIVVVTSTDNGTNWNGPTIVAPAAGESTCFTGACQLGYFESTPEIAFAYSPSGSDLYVVYAATYDQGAGVTGNFNHTGLFAAVSTDSGATWSVGAMDAASGPTALRDFEPAIGISSQEVYVSFLVANESAGQWGFANSLTDFVQTVPTGAAGPWSVPTANGIESFVYGGSVNSTRTSFPGFTSSVAIVPGGRAVLAYALPQPSTYTVAKGTGYYYANTSYPTELVTGSLVRPGDPDAVTVWFNQTGIPTGDSWQFTLNGLVYTLATPSIEFTNVPAGVAMMVGAYYIGGYWSIDGSYFNASLATFFSNTSYIFPFQVWVGIEFNLFPSGPGIGSVICPGCDSSEIIDSLTLSSPFGYASGFWEIFSGFICTPTGCTFGQNSENSWSSSIGSSYCYLVSALCNWTTPWYFPLGSTIELSTEQWSYYGLTPTYWTGNGAGSYTGLTEGSCYDSFDCFLSTGPMTMLGPINETLWLADGPVNLTRNLTFSAYGLPGSSVFHFSMNGVPYSGSAASGVTIPDVPSGAYKVTSVWATAPEPGWEYFGYVNDPNPFLSAALTAVNLTFDALVNVSAPPGVVTFHAPGLAPGTSWAVTFNDTTRTSITPWINFTSRPGTFLWSVGDAVAPSGTAGYVPTGIAPSISVTPGTTYLVTYVPAYLVRLMSSPGGLVSANGGFPTNEVSVWEAAGAAVGISVTLSAGYSFVGWSGTGVGSYSGSAETSTVTANGPIVDSATFQPLPGARFNLTLTSKGLPTGTWWTANLAGSGHSTNGSSLTVGNLWPWTATSGAGEYNLSVPITYLNGTNLTRFVPTPPPPAVVGTNGSFTPPVLVNFEEQSLVQLQALPGNGGTVLETVGGNSEGNSYWAVPGTPITIFADKDPGFVFTGWEGSGPGAYTGTAAQTTITAYGPITEVASFAPATTPPLPHYALTFHLATPLAAGTVWSVVFGGEGYSSNGANLTIPSVLGGTYGVAIETAVAPSGQIEYQATATDPVAYTVRGNATLDIAFQTYYWVSISAAIGGSVSVGSGFYQGGSLLYIVATANASYTFEGFLGSGDGHYSGTNSTAAIFVSGPLTEVAMFESTPVGASSTSSFWSSPLSWLGIGALALIGGLVVGTIGARLRARPAAPAPPPPPASGRGSNP